MYNKESKEGPQRMYWRKQLNLEFQYNPLWNKHLLRLNSGVSGVIISVDELNIWVELSIAVTTNSVCWMKIKLKLIEIFTYFLCVKHIDMWFELLGCRQVSIAIFTGKNITFVNLLIMFGSNTIVRKFHFAGRATLHFFLSDYQSWCQTWCRMCNWIQCEASISLCLAVIVMIFVRRTWTSCCCTWTAPLHARTAIWKVRLGV